MHYCNVSCERSAARLLRQTIGEHFGEQYDKKIKQLRVYIEHSMQATINSITIIMWNLCCDNRFRLLCGNNLAGTGSRRWLLLI